MKLRIINDIHLYGVNPTHTIDDISFAIQSSPYPVYLLGDVVDIANCPYKKLFEAHMVLNLLRDKVQKRGGQYIMGNHECDVTATEFIVLDGTIVLTHGDYPMWGNEKTVNYRAQKEGAGWVKRNLVSKVIDGLRRYWQVRPNDNVHEWIEQRQKELPLLRIVVMGHSHPPKIIEFQHNNVKGYILPRGINDIEV